MGEGIANVGARIKAEASETGGAGALAEEFDERGGRRKGNSGLARKWCRDLDGHPRKWCRVWHRHPRRSGRRWQRKAKSTTKNASDLFVGIENRRTEGERTVNGRGVVLGL